MGSPKKQRKKFTKPSHPWQKERILAESELLKSYGLKRKYEIWKMNTILKNFTAQAKNLITSKNIQVEKERNQLLTRLFSLGLIGKGAKIEDVLSLTLKDILERRLQTLVFRKNIARSLNQSRQFIVHEHISIDDRVITAPSYIVPLEHEKNIQFSQNSILFDVNHPERLVMGKEEKEKKAKTPGKLKKSDETAKKPKSGKEVEMKEDKIEEKKIDTGKDLEK
jgi:small subunit ribosomal protein S4